MPVILPDDEYDRWLDPKCDDPSKLLKSYSAEEMTAFPVTTLVDDRGTIHQRASIPSRRDDDAVRQGAFDRR